MDFALLNLIEGISIGIIISIPLGPVGLITMKRTAEFGLRAGIISGFAIALIDTIASIIMLLILGKSLSFFSNLPPWFYAIGGVVLFFYGLRMMVTPPVRCAEADKPWHQHFASSVVLTLTNPSTYISFGVIALFLTRFIGRSFFDRLEVVIGFFIGAFLWWCMLAWIAFTNRDKYLTASKIQHAVGIIIMVLAIYTIFMGPIRAHTKHFSVFEKALNHRL